MPIAPRGASPLLRSPDGALAAFSFPLWQGRVVVLPGDALSNGRLASAGNADLLESLLSLGGTWTLDEFHHGLAAPSSPADARLSGVFDLYLIHLAFLYLVTVLAISRRFGPPWTEPPTIAGSTAAFFLGLGRLHHRLGHHAEAARLLVKRARELDPRLRVEDVPLPGVSDSDRLVDLARDIARAQAGGE